MVCLELEDGFLRCSSAEDLLDTTATGIQEVIFTQSINWDVVSAVFESMPRIKCGSSPIVCEGEIPSDAFVDCTCIGDYVEATFTDVIPNSTSIMDVATSSPTISSEEAAGINSVVSVDVNSTSAFGFPSLDTVSDLINSTIITTLESLGNVSTTENTWNDVPRGNFTRKVEEEGDWNLPSEGSSAPAVIPLVIGIVLTIQLGCLIWCFRGKIHKVNIYTHIFISVFPLFHTYYLYMTLFFRFWTPAPDGIVHIPLIQLRCSLVSSWKKLGCVPINIVRPREIWTCSRLECVWTECTRLSLKICVVKNNWLILLEPMIKL